MATRPQRNVSLSDRILSEFHLTRPEVWTIYKEVATYYAAGLIPPEVWGAKWLDDATVLAQRGTESFVSHIEKLTQMVSACHVLCAVSRVPILKTNSRVFF